MNRTRRPGRIAAASLYGIGALSLVVAVYIIVTLSQSPDSDWVVGVITAAPTALLGVVAIVLARSVGRQHLGERYGRRPLPDYRHDPYWARMVLACKWAVRCFAATLVVGIPVSLIHGVVGRVVMALGMAVFAVPFAVMLGLSLHAVARRAAGSLPGPFSDWNNAAWWDGFRLAWRAGAADGSADSRGHQER